jgi:hypothetical protein
MNSKRITMLIAAGGALAALVTSAATAMRSRPSHQPQVMPAAQPVDVAGAALAEEVARLRARLHPTAEPQHPERNLFRFAAGDRSAAALAPSAPDPVAAPPAAASPAIVPKPALALIGMAEQKPAAGDRSDQLAAAPAPIRTAIISGMNQLFLVKTGETIGDRYRVVAIAERAVEIRDLDADLTIRLELP